MNLNDYREEMSAAIETLRRSLAAAHCNDECRRAICEARREVKRIQHKGKHLIEDRVTQHKSFFKMRRSRIFHGQQDILMIDEMAANALAVIEGLASGDKRLSSP